MYLVKDQNGDILYESDSWVMAMSHMKHWLIGGDSSLNGAGIWDSETEIWQYRFYAARED